jgi:hypothetical protein
MASEWLARVPHHFTSKDRAAGYRYDLSILQAEFSLTQVLDRPLTGVFFEELIRESVDSIPIPITILLPRPGTRSRGRCDHPRPGSRTG